MWALNVIPLSTFNAQIATHGTVHLIVMTIIIWWYILAVNLKAVLLVSWQVSTFCPSYSYTWRGKKLDNVVNIRLAMFALHDHGFASTIVMEVFFQKWPCSMCVSVGLQLMVQRTQYAWCTVNNKYGWHNMGTTYHTPHRASASLQRLCLFVFFKAFSLCTGLVVPTLNKIQDRLFWSLISRQLFWQATNTVQVTMALYAGLREIHAIYAKQPSCVVSTKI